MTGWPTARLGRSIQPNKSTMTVRCYFHWNPAMPWLGGRRQWPAVWHSREVGLFSTAWAYLLKDAACFPGVGTGFLNCCHGISFVNSEKPRTFKTPIVSLARLLYASRTFLAERWQVSPGNRFPTKAAQSSYLFAAFLFY